MPFGDRHLRAVALRLVGRIGLDLMAALTAPYNETDADC
jgi:hypothetical protein